MTRFVIDPDAALQLARHDVALPAEHQLVAPTLLRSQLLALLFGKVRAGDVSKAEADRYLDYVRSQRIRLLGDRVLQSVAWKVADQLGWPDTYRAEYIALTQLQADVLIALDPELAAAAGALVTVQPVEVLG